MNELSNRQNEIIDQGRRIDFPLNKLVKINEVPLMFSTQPRELLFYQISLGLNLLWALAPDASPSDDYDFFDAVVVKKGKQPMIIICTGVDIGSTAHKPIAAIFNLTPEKSMQVIVAPLGKQPRELINWHQPAGGLGLSRLLRGNPKNEFVEITADSKSLFISPTQPGKPAAI